jgi:hypothetical protein
MEHTSQDRRCKVVHRYSESEDLVLGGGYNVWIRTDRNHSAYLCDRLGRTQPVEAVSRRP